MIIDVPSPQEFVAAGLSQIYLAWQIALKAVHDYEQATWYRAADEIDQEEIAEYWRRSQPALTNAFSLVQQGMELALKGRIAAVSPYLLLGNPADWPDRSANQDISFGTLRTLDAKDLVKVHNSVCNTPLDVEFQRFWEEVRRDRNNIMHSVATKSYDPGTLVRTILTAVSCLFDGVAWPKLLAEMISDGTYEAFGFDDRVHNLVLSQVDGAIKHLLPKEAQRFFNFDKRRRSYICPDCYNAAELDWLDTCPKLAQLVEKSAGSNVLSCVVCDTLTTVAREACHDPKCEGDVIAAGMCLSCALKQDQYFHVSSGLTDDSLSPADHTYRFVFSKGVAGAGALHAQDRQLLPSDRNAKGHAAYVLRQGHLQVWNAVTILHVESREPFYAPPKERVLGYWRRQGSDLEWVAGLRADTPDWDAEL